MRNKKKLIGGAEREFYSKIQKISMPDKPITREQIQMLNPNKLWQMRNWEKLTIVEIAKKIGVSKTFIWRRLKEYEID